MIDYDKFFKPYDDDWGISPQDPDGMTTQVLPKWFIKKEFEIIHPIYLFSYPSKDDGKLGMRKTAGEFARGLIGCSGGIARACAQARMLIDICGEDAALPFLAMNSSTKNKIVNSKSPYSYVYAIPVKESGYSQRSYSDISEAFNLGKSDAMKVSTILGLFSIGHLYEKVSGVCVLAKSGDNDLGKIPLVPNVFNFLTSPQVEDFEYSCKLLSYDYSFWVRFVRLYVRHDYDTLDDALQKRVIVNTIRHHSDYEVFYRQIPDKDRRQGIHDKLHYHLCNEIANSPTLAPLRAEALRQKFKYEAPDIKLL